MEPAAISARPARTMMREEATRSGETGGEGEGDGESVGEADDYVAHSCSGLEVAFDVRV